MRQLFDDLVIGLNEAIEGEKENLKVKKTTLSIEPVKQFGNIQIKKIRNDAGMTQAVFASYMGVSQKTVEAWEKGTNRPSGSACRLLEILESSLAWKLPFIKSSKR